MKEMVRELVTPTTAALQRRMQLALGALRGVTLTWSAVVCAIDAQSGVLDRPTAAAALLAVLAAWSAVWTAGVHRRDRWVSGVTGIVVDLALACVAIGADHWVYDGTHPQSFASAWPVVAVVATGVGAGAWWGLAGGTAVGVANVIGASMIGTGMDGAWLSSWGSLVLIAASGWVGGWVAERLRTTAQAAADAQARADVARTLHDGVLQTLAVIQRRSDDADLVALAKEQDAELRTFLRGEYTHSTTAAHPDSLDSRRLQRPEQPHRNRRPSDPGDKPTPTPPATAAPATSSTSLRVCDPSSHASGERSRSTCNSWSSTRAAPRVPPRTRSSGRPQKRSSTRPSTRRCSRCG